MTDDITLPELGRRMERLEADIVALGHGLHRRLDELNYVHPETLDTKLMLEAAHRRDLERRVGVIEAGNQWLWRTVVGLVLAIVLTGLVAAAGLS